MPFSALYIPENRVVTIDDGGQQPRELWRLGELRCHLPGCEHPMTIVCGSERAFHFRHMNGECGCDFVDAEQRAESHEHRLGKRFVARGRSSELQEAGIHGFTVHFERPFPSVRRIADVCLVYAGGWSEVHEVQCSHIDPGELENRIHDYWSAGADVWWWFSDSLGVANRAAIDKAKSMGVPLGSFTVETHESRG